MGQIREVQCPRCNGSGYTNDTLSGRGKCSRCDGRGALLIDEQNKEVAQAGAEQIDDNIAVYARAMSVSRLSENKELRVDLKDLFKEQRRNYALAAAVNVFAISRATGRGFGPKDSDNQSMEYSDVVKLAREINFFLSGD